MPYGYDEEEDLTIDFSKILQVLQYRRILIIQVFLFFVLFFIALTFILPKKYEAEANIYINKSSDTNLAELNPYIISSLTGTGGISGILSGAGDEIQDELEIMQSPMVIDKVIRKNNIRYRKGKKKGEYFSTHDFMKKNISIENKKGSKIVSIIYKSKDPLLSYNVVKSIISSYEKVHEEINIQKTIKDKELLENAYLDTNEQINKKLEKMRKRSVLPDTAMNSLGSLATLKGHNKAISRALSSVQNQVIENQRAQISVEQDVDKLKLVKSKLEWTNLVEKMSKDTTNIIVLKHPEIKRKFENSSPKLLINLILGILFGVIASIIAVVLAEFLDKKLTYSVLGDKVIYNIEENIDDLKLLFLAKPQEKFLFITFEGFSLQTFKKLDEFTNLKAIDASLSFRSMEDLSNSNNIILAGKIGQTPKKFYQQIKVVCTESNKTICAEVV